MMLETLWTIVSDCICNDDGSLPGIEIGSLSCEGVTRIYAMLRKRSCLFGTPSEFWSITQQKSLPVDSVANAATLVTSGAAQAFHLCISGIVIAGTTLPMLGVFVCHDTIEIDYRMGSHWGPSEVSGFFELLSECCDLDSRAIVVPADFEGPPFPDRFKDTWNHFRTERN